MFLIKIVGVNLTKKGILQIWVSLKVVQKVKKERKEINYEGRS